MLTFILESQPEGGWTVTCKEIRELVTEVDEGESLEFVIADAMESVKDLYDHQGIVFDYDLRKPYRFICDGEEIKL